jgi:hypothetical protein
MAALTTQFASPIDDVVENQAEGWSESLGVEQAQAASVHDNQVGSRLGD